MRDSIFENNEGTKFRMHGWGKGTFFVPSFYKNGAWVGVSNSESVSIFFGTRSEWGPYTEPPKTETRWLWSMPDGYITKRMYHTTPLGPNGEILYAVKLEWSATEFPMEQD